MENVAFVSIMQKRSNLPNVERSIIIGFRGKMSDDEEDYMSASFLEVKEDIRPGLTFNKSLKRKNEIEKKRIESSKLQKITSRKYLEEESRKVGLDSAISSDNKGFAMLQKMGYKPGMKLGLQKDDSSDRGLIEPIKVKVKTGREGFGREEEINRNIERLKERRIYRAKEVELLTEDFRQRMREASSYKQLSKDLYKCQKVCEQLDKSNEIDEPSRSWFWFTQEESRESDEDEFEDDEEEEIDDLSIEEKIEIISDYLRNTYFYCFWCCIQYNDFDDLQQNCPGPEKSSHEDF